MSTAVSSDPRIKTVEVSDEMITAHLADGRIISVPLAWSWRLASATPAQRANYEIIGDGHGVHWPDVDENISAEGMLSGTPARPPKARA
jgi:hypothetical protein